MQFIVETGEGLEDATSYVSVQEADDYIALFYDSLDADWTALTSAEKEVILMRATTYVDDLIRYTSSLKDDEQALNWPRLTFEDRNGRKVKGESVPRAIKEATIEVAFASISSNIFEEEFSITREMYGSSSVDYAGPIKVGGNSVIKEITKKLLRLGYGVREANIITLERA